MQTAVDPLVSELAELFVDEAWLSPRSLHTERLAVDIQDAIEHYLVTAERAEDAELNAKLKASILARKGDNQLHRADMAREEEKQK